MMQETSLAAYQSIQKNISNMQLKVYHVFDDGFGYTNWEVSEKLGKPINSITPRVYELRQKGILQDSGIRRISRGGRKSIVWRKRT